MVQPFVCIVRPGLNSCDAITGRTGHALGRKSRIYSRKLLHGELEPVHLTQDLVRKSGWRHRPFRRAQLRHASPPVAQGRLEAEHTLRREQAFDLVRVPDALGQQCLPLAYESAGVLGFSRR